jgi:hypothetical protein
MICVENVVSASVFKYVLNKNAGVSLRRIHGSEREEQVTL